MSLDRSLSTALDPPASYDSRTWSRSAFEGALNNAGVLAWGPLGRRGRNIALSNAVYLDEGRIVETGSPEDLMAKADGAYKRFVDLQIGGSAA